MLLSHHLFLGTWIAMDGDEDEGFSVDLWDELRIDRVSSISYEKRRIKVEHKALPSEQHVRVPHHVIRTPVYLQHDLRS